MTDQASIAPAPSTNSDFSELDRALNHMRCSLEGPQQPSNSSKTSNSRLATNSMLKRHHSLPHGPDARSSEGVVGPISSRTRRAVQNKSNPSNRYETPNEEEELLSEVLASAQKAVNDLDRQSNKAGAECQKKPVRTAQPNIRAVASYPTPSPSANRNGVNFSQPYATPTKPLEISKNRATKDEGPSKWPTPPYDENDWASSVAASLMATQSMYR